MTKQPLIAAALNAYVPLRWGSVQAEERQQYNSFFPAVAPTGACLHLAQDAAAMGRSCYAGCCFAITAADNCQASIAGLLQSPQRQHS